MTCQAREKNLQQTDSTIVIIDLLYKFKRQMRSVK